MIVVARQLAADAEALAVLAENGDDLGAQTKVFTLTYPAKELVDLAEALRRLNKRQKKAQKKALR